MPFPFPIRTAPISVPLAFALLAACASTPPAAPVQIAPPPAVPGASAAPAPLPTPPPRALFLRGSDEENLQVWEVGAGDAAPRRLGFTVGITIDGTMGLGSNFPQLSPDGAWLAYGKQGRLWLGHTDGTPPEPITQFTEGTVRLLLSGWSPDSNLLLFYQGEREMEDGNPPLPPGVEEGFYLLRIADRRVVRTAGVRGFDMWESDSRHVLFQDYFSRASLGLMRADVLGNEVTVVLDAPGTRLDQVSDRNGLITYILQHQVLKSKADGSDVVELTPKGAWAEYQFPKLSPDGGRVAYLHRETAERGLPDTTSIEVATTTPRERKQLLRCRGERMPDFAWEGPSALLVVDAGDLVRVGIDGKKTPIATEVKGLVMAKP